MAAPCIHCGEQPKALPAHRCRECLLSREPVDVQIAAARERRSLSIEVNGSEIPAVKRELWPEGRRWCSGCQSYRRYDRPGTPLDVRPGASKCRVCEVSSRREQTYGLTPKQDAQLGTTCNVCERSQRFQSLAVDHDHATGKVRGKLCYRCNHLVIGPAEFGWTPLDYFRKVVQYLEDPPAQRLTN
jgi:hypothetical protein